MRSSRSRSDARAAVRATCAASPKRLPFRDAAFDAVVACLVFEHIPDHEPAIAEVARVLEPGGRFVFLLNHPLLAGAEQRLGRSTTSSTSSTGASARTSRPTSRWRSSRRVSLLPFVHRPLSHYVNAMARSRLLIERMEEPHAARGFPRQGAGVPRRRTIPRLLLMVARRTA